jgi:hypothetical protein
VDVRAVDNTVTQSLEPGAPAGTYTVLWRVTSVDGHPVSGRFTFTAIAAAPGTRPAHITAPAAPRPTHADRGVDITMLVAGAVAVVAVAAVLLLSRRQRATG